MSLLEIAVLALALSLDAFAVSLAASTAGHVKDWRAAFRLIFHFGLFQAVMPVLGWALGTTIEPLIATFDHWVAFGMLVFVAVRMVRAGLRPVDATAGDDPSRGLILVMLSTATSIDALAVGLSLAMLRTQVWYPSLMIGAVTAVVCAAAVIGGRRLGDWAGSRAQFAGAAVLLMIAGRILVTHMV